MMKKLPKLVVILGQTAAGKTALSVKLAKKFNGEIISADSRQIYEEMNIGTAKPTKKELKGIPYYLIEILPPDKEFNVAIYKKIATQTIREIQKMGKLPFLVGGTGLYIQAIVDNLQFPRALPQKKIREKLERKTEIKLFEIYKKLDPVGAKTIDKKNKRRLIRAIEVCKTTGEPFWKQRKRGKSLFDVLQIGIKVEKEELKKRVEKRVEKMFRDGLEKEVKQLVKKYGWITPLQTIGYQEWKDYFESKIEKEKVKKLIIQHTIQFAKRQMTWFKKDKRIHWIKTQKEAEKLIKNFFKKIGAI